MSAIKSIKYFHATATIYAWNSIGMPEECIENITKSNSNFVPTFVDHYSLPNIIFNEHYLIKSNISIPKKSNKSIYICYISGTQLRNTSTDFTLSNCLFGSVKLTKNADPNKYKCNNYIVGFDSRSEFPYTGGSIGRHIVIVGGDISSTVYVDNKGKSNLILGEG